MKVIPIAEGTILFLNAKNRQSEPLKTEFFEPAKKPFQTML